MSTDYHREFQPTGDWWTMPMWHKVVLLVTLRPFCKVKGWLAVVRQWVALRSPNRPFEPFSWVHKDPCYLDADWPHDHDEFHPEAHDHCVTGYHGGTGPHFLSYERDLDVPYSFADDFDVRVGRMYTFVDH